MASATHPLFVRLRDLAQDAPIVVAHRGDSVHRPENTLAAFAAAKQLGVVVQEFDVRASRDGVLVCMHDATCDRTTDSARRFGPGALVEQMSAAELRLLEVRGVDPAAAAERVPTLAAVLDLLAPHDVAVVEHKAGDAAAFVRTIGTAGAAPRTIVQSFDWKFVAAVRAAAPDQALAVLGPTRQHERCDARAIEAALRLGAGMVHWYDRALRAADVEAAHAAGLLVCTYTTDDEPGFAGACAIGIDAMCTNVPGAMLALRGTGAFRRRPAASAQ